MKVRKIGKIRFCKECGSVMVVTMHLHDWQDRKFRWYECTGCGCGEWVRIE